MNEKVKSVFRTAIEAVLFGNKFHIDFKERSMKVGDDYLLKNGKTDGLIDGKLCTKEEFVQGLEDYYHNYKHSIPSERSESKGKRYFRALKEEKLTDDDMLYGFPRDLAQVELEVFVLEQMVLGFQWPEDWGWFWQSGKDKDLVLLREWFEA